MSSVEWKRRLPDDHTQNQVQVGLLRCFPSFTQRYLGEVLPKVDDRVMQVVSADIALAASTVVIDAPFVGCCGIKVAKILLFALLAVLKVRIAVQFRELSA